MFRHVVMFTFQEGTSAAQIDAISSALRGLPAAIPEIRSYSFGRDAGINAGNHQFAVTATFDSADGYLVYRDHPEHLRVIKELIAPVLGSRAAVQFAEEA